MPNRLFDRTIGLIQRSLDLRTLRHKALSTNIANSETPNYRAQDIPFQKVLDHSIHHASSIRLERTHPNHLREDWGKEIEMDSSIEEVDIDQEMAKLAENNLMFQAGVQALLKKLENLKLTIQEGGK